MTQGGDRAALTKQLKNAFHHYPAIFQTFGKPYKETNISTMHNT